MTAPALPEIFGNYALGDFNEVVSPAAISWLPQTPGWYLVAGALALWLSRLAWRRLRRWYRNRYRREALAELARMERIPDELDATSLNRLLKLTALAAWPRPQVAPLTGTDWVEFLNSQCEDRPFEGALGQQLALAPYGVAVAAVAPQTLAGACRHWIAQHRSPLDV